MATPLSNATNAARALPRTAAAMPSASPSPALPARAKWGPRPRPAVLDLSHSCHLTFASFRCGVLP